MFAIVIVGLKNRKCRLTKRFRSGFVAQAFPFTEIRFKIKLQILLLLFVLISYSRLEL